VKGSPRNVGISAVNDAGQTERGRRVRVHCSLAKLRKARLAAAARQTSKQILRFPAEGFSVQGRPPPCPVRSIDHGSSVFCGGHRWLLDERRYSERIVGRAGAGESGIQRKRAGMPAEHQQSLCGSPLGPTILAGCKGCRPLLRASAKRFTRGRLSYTTRREYVMPS
jgi:hypothetical protein